MSESHVDVRVHARPVLACLLLGFGLLAAAPAARAETRQEYINRYVLVIDWVNRSEAWVSAHLEDPSLARAAHGVAEQQVEIGRRMTPPSEFESIHPHLLLVLENAERMFAFAAAGNRDAYRRHRRILQDEQRLISEILMAEGRLMPEITP